MGISFLEIFKMDLVFFTFFIPSIVAMYLASQQFLKHTKLYRKEKNPNFFLPGETMNFFKRDPEKYLQTMIIMPFLWWKIVFEKHKDTELNSSAQKLRILLLIPFIILLIHFAFFFINEKFGLQLV